MTPLDVLVVALLGGVVGLDVVSFPQAMISRPLVAATLGGAFLGAPAAGLLLGAVLELFALGTLPVGASRYPEWGSAAVAGGALHAALLAAPAGTSASALPVDGALLVSLFTALVTAYVGGVSMVYLRRLNARWAHRVLPELRAGRARTVNWLQLVGLTADLTRGVLVTLLALLLALPAAALALEGWRAAPRAAFLGVGVLAGAAAAAAAWKHFHGAPQSRRWFAGGLAVGALLLLLVR